MSYQTAEDLAVAKEWIRQVGWWPKDKGGAQVCAQGAINMAVGLDPSWHDTEWGRANNGIEAMGAVVGGLFGSLPEWNDHPSRTKKQVLAAFDKAIAAELAKP